MSTSIFTFDSWTWTVYPAQLLPSVKLFTATLVLLCTVVMSGLWQRSWSCAAFRCEGKSLGRHRFRSAALSFIVFTLCAKLSGAVYCNRSCLSVCVFVSLWVCYHDNSKLRASIFTKLGLYVKVVAISSRLKYVGGPAPPGRGSAAGQKKLASQCYSQRGSPMGDPT